MGKLYKIKKIILLLISLILMLASVSCSKEKALVLGTNDAFPPFSSMGGENGDEMVGFDIELAKRIADNYEANLEISIMSFDDLLQSVEKGTIDMAICSITVTEPRKEMVDFSEPYYSTSQVAVIRREDETLFKYIATKEELGSSGKLAAQAGTTGYAVATEVASGEPVVELGSWITVLVELSVKNVDIAILDREAATTFTSQYSNIIKLNHIEFGTEFYAVAVAKGNTKLLNTVNDTIAEIKESGEYDALIEQYINVSSE